MLLLKIIVAIFLLLNITISGAFRLRPSRLNIEMKVEDNAFIRANRAARSAGAGDRFNMFNMNYCEVVVDMLYIISHPP